MRNAEHPGRESGYWRCRSFFAYQLGRWELRLEIFGHGQQDSDQVIGVDHPRTTTAVDGVLNRGGRFADGIGDRLG